MTLEITSFVEILSDRAQYHSNKQAYIFLQDGENESGSLTYGELDKQARVIAASLQPWRGERALLLYPSGLEFIAAFFGCLYAGVVAVPAYPPRHNQKLSRLLSIVNDAQSKIALTTTSILTDLKKRSEDKVELAQLNLVATDTIEANSQDYVPRSVAAENLAFLQYTSGSTGTPKGVMITHGNLIHNQHLIHQAFGHSEQSIGAGWLPLFHDMGLIGHVLQPIYVGFPSILMPPVALLQKPIRWLNTISKYKVTTSGGPNFAYEMCVRKLKPEDLASLNLSTWELAYNGSEPILADTLERFTEKFAVCGFRRSAFYPCYGMAEATLFVTGGLKAQEPVIQESVVAANLSQGRNQKIVGCGFPWLDTKVVIVDPESLIPLTEGEIGEIWISGRSIADGYWNQPKETTEIFKGRIVDLGEENFLRTGDLGFLKDRELFVTGRLKDVIIIRGQNHYPHDIELTVQSSHPALRLNCGAAFTVDLAGEQKLIVIQEVERSHLNRLDAKDVFGNVTQSVTANHGLQIHQIVLIKPGSIPKTSSGKIKHHACRSSYLDGTLVHIAKNK